MLERDDYRPVLTEEQAKALTDLAGRVREVFTASSSGDVARAAGIVNGLLQEFGAAPRLDLARGGGWALHFHGSDDGIVTGWGAGIAAGLGMAPVGGHTADGMAIVVPWARVLIAGDHLSPVEIPMVGESAGALDEYLLTLDRLEPLVEAEDVVIPGHGEPIDSERALAILREDRDYLRALAADGAAAPLPLARRTQAQKVIHHQNVARIAPD